MHAVPVLPLIDLHSGEVQFTLHGAWQVLHTSEPQRLLRLLTRAAGPARFDPAHGRLLVFLPRRGTSGGRPVAFSLAKFPAHPLVTTLDADDGRAAEHRGVRPLPQLL